MLKNAVKKTIHFFDLFKNKRDIKKYISNEKKPWSSGYQQSKFNFIQKILNDEAIMKKFESLQLLPDNFGYGYDERVVEYPGALSRLSSDKEKLLDAGSCFNYFEIINNILLGNKNLTVFTLSPEGKSFLRKGISYVYGDLRKMLFKDNGFDSIYSISTLGHVGMDNRIYTKNNEKGKVGLEAEITIQELIRILKVGCKLLISVVFGKHQLINYKGSLFAEQFNSKK